MNKIAAKCKISLLGLLLLTAPIWDTHAANETAAWSEIEITPPLGVALGGRGGNYVHANEILDPLFAQILYIRDAQSNGLVLVSLDLIGLPHDVSDRIRASLVHELGVEWNQILLNCSHTHSGPNMLREIMAGVAPFPQNEIDYFKTLQGKIISAARTLAKNVKPSSIEVFAGASRVAINRRGKNKAGSIGIIPNVQGPIDDTLWVMKVTPRDGGSPAVIFSYACHPVIVYGYKNRAISADFPGVARQKLREKLGAKTHLQFVQGLAGNVRPRACADLEKNTFSKGGPKVLEEAGQTLANDVLDSLKRKSRVLDLNIASASDRPLLPRGHPPDQLTYEKMADQKSDNARAVAAYWLERYHSGEGFAKADAWPVGLIRLSDDQWIVHLAGEPVVEWRKKISQWLPGKNFVPFGYCQEANTYLPTEELLPEGGYEVLECNRARASSPAAFAKGIHEAVRVSLLRQLAFINAKTNK